MKKLIQFVKNAGLIHPAVDTKGNKYFTGSFWGYMIIRASIKMKEKAGVCALKTGEKEYTITGWY